MKAVILAGGKGRRLKPYTTVFPKPLMPIGEKPILEIILSQLVSHGFDDISLTVGHLAELIVTFFGDGSKFGARISYSREDKPLGTAGCLAPLKGQIGESFLSMNGDILTDLDFSDFFAYHRAHGGIATIALTKRILPVDFGVVETDPSNTIVGYREKPTIEYYVSMGIYAFEPRILEYIRPNEYLDFPDLVQTLLREGETVKAYPFKGFWLDIGRPDDYELANRKYGDQNDLLHA